jgi:hypothetical protein
MHNIKRKVTEEFGDFFSKEGSVGAAQFNSTTQTSHSEPLMSTQSIATQTQQQSPMTNHSFFSIQPYQQPVSYFPQVHHPYPYMPPSFGMVQPQYTLPFAAFAPQHHPYPFMEPPFALHSPGFNTFTFAQTSQPAFQFNSQRNQQPSPPSASVSPVHPPVSDTRKRRRSENPEV